MSRWANSRSEPWVRSAHHALRCIHFDRQTDNIRRVYVHARFKPARVPLVRRRSRSPMPMVEEVDRRIRLAEKTAAAVALFAEELQRVTGRLEEFTASSSHVHVHFRGSAPAVAAEATAVSKPLSASSVTGPPEVRPLVGLDAKVRHYCVISGNGGPECGIGTYRTYNKFVAAVIDPLEAKWWVSGGTIPWARGAEGCGFKTRREAEAHVRERLGLSTAEPVPHFG